MLCDWSDLRRGPAGSQSKSPRHRGLRCLGPSRLIPTVADDQRYTRRNVPFGIPGMMTSNEAEFSRLPKSTVPARVVPVARSVPVSLTRTPSNPSP